MSFSRAKQRQARGYAGITKLRKTLRRIEPEATDGIKVAIKNGAEAIESAILFYGHDHHITGDMLQSVDTKLGRDGMTAVIGPGAGSISVSKSPFNTTLYVSQTSKHDAWQFFKAYWIEFGTKGAAARMITSGPYKGRMSPEIPPLPAKPFVQPAWDSNKTSVIASVKQAVKNALMRASNG